MAVRTGLQMTISRSGMASLRKLGWDPGRPRPGSLAQAQERTPAKIGAYPHNMRAGTPMSNGYRPTLRIRPQQSNGSQARVPVQWRHRNRPLRSRTVNFRIRGLSPEPFRHLYGLSDQQLGAHAALRYVADRDGGFPDRIELRDSRVSESFLLVNFVHQPAANPYRASHAVFVREGAEHPYDRIDEVPESMRTRLLSLRAFSADDLIVDADVVEGQRAD